MVKDLIGAFYMIALTIITCILMFWKRPPEKYHRTIATILDILFVIGLVVAGLK